MARDGSGNYNLPSGNPVVTNTVISSSGWANPTLTDIAAALTQSLSKDGQTTPTANLPMGNFRHTNVANAANRTDYAAAGQVQDSVFHWLTSVAGTDTITANLSTPPLAAYAAGQAFRFIAAGKNLTTAVTLNINSIGAKNVTKNGANALQIGDVPNAVVIVDVVYDGTQFQIVSIIPVQSAAPVVGSIRNARMSVAAASASGTFTADEVIVETALGGVPYRLSSYSQAINLATTGAGGMDTGTAPVNGYVALYAIYNPATAATSILATNAATLQGNVYGGANMPAGYTASSLLGVWPTNASSQFQIGIIADRKFFTGNNTALNTSTQQVSLTSLSISGNVPVNAKTVWGGYNLGSSAITNTLGAIASSSTGIGNIGLSGVVAAAGEAIAGPFPEIPLITAQAIFYSCQVGAGTMSFSIGIAGYSF